ncbi:ribokinase [Vibrio sp. CK2-1]|uniref:ribokinase n=1 Tax=Vibrio sp. CK2-1 TaxID=2912249 RepID=UPI001F00FFA5|nr:ribokinase [Vibrio sp. CK2-1]MCF7353463.1 ribokinase [Vibrio sp. CK2-1]
MNKLIVLGSVNADHVLQVPSFPRPGETLMGRNYQVIPGGKGANQAVAAARLGADIGFIACVGSDSFGQNIIQSFAQDGINTDYVSSIPSTPTGVALIQVSDEGENSICLSPEANNALDQERVSIFKDPIQHCDYLLLQLETPLDGIESAIKLAKSSSNADIKVVLNPAPAKALPDSILNKIDIITPNETEAEVLTGIAVTDDNSAQAAANNLHEKGISTVIITLGAKGVWLSENGKGKIIQGFKVKALDTTAAGDTFNGAFVTALLEGVDTVQAIYFAHAAAALSVTRFGAQTSIPTRQETDNFLVSQSL